MEREIVSYSVAFAGRFIKNPMYSTPSQLSLKNKAFQ